MDDVIFVDLTFFLHSFFLELFLQVIQTTGVSAVAVHGRTKDERPNNPNHLDVLQKVAEHCKIPMIANGGSANTRDSPINTYEGKVKFISSNRFISGNHLQLDENLLVNCDWLATSWTFWINICGLHDILAAVFTGFCVTAW